MTFLGTSNSAHTNNRLIEVAEYTRRVTFENLNLRNAGYDGLVILHEASDITVSKCFVSGCQDDGINVGGDATGTPATETVVQGNTVRDCVNDGIHISDGSKRTVVTANVITRCGNGVGIYNSTENIITSNMITNVVRGIWTISGTCDYLTISDNIVDTASTAGLVLAHSHIGTQVIGNKFLNINSGSSDAISITQTSNPIQVQNNLAYNSSDQFDYGFAGLNRRGFIEVVDNFIGQIPAATSPAGPFAFFSATSGTGAALARLSGTVGSIAGWQCQNGTTTNGRAAFNSSLSLFRFSGGYSVLQMRVRVPVLSDATDTFTTTHGFGDTVVNGNQVDGFFAIYSSQADYYTNATKWSAMTANNSTYTEIPSSLTVVANQWYMMTFVINAAGTSCDFYIDDALIGASTTNIPTTSGREFGIICKSERVVGTTNNRNFDVNFCWWRHRMSTPY